MYAKIQDNQVAKFPYTVQDLRDDNPDTGFGKDIPDEMWGRFGAVRVIVTGQPEHNPLTQKVIESTPAYISERDRWEQQWQIVSLDAEEIAAIEASMRNDNAARAKQALLDTDWCENPSVCNTSFTPHLTNGDDYDAYRLILRAIVVNEPAVVETWPARPNSVWSS